VGAGTTACSIKTHLHDDDFLRIYRRRHDAHRDQGADHVLKRVGGRAFGARRWWSAADAVEYLLDHDPDITMDRFSRTASWAPREPGPAGRRMAAAPPA
jgi:hypothetical protein